MDSHSSSADGDLEFFKFSINSEYQTQTKFNSHSVGHTMRHAVQSTVSSVVRTALSWASFAPQRLRGH